MREALIHTNNDNRNGSERRLLKKNLFVKNTFNN